MNQDNENNRPGDEIDPFVSSQYRSSATERAPPTLDATILTMAEAAVRDTGLRGFTAVWFRPLAFVTTLGLSLALLLELTGTPQRQPVMRPEANFGRREAESIVADPAPALIGVMGTTGGGADSATAKDRTNAPGQRPQPGATPSRANIGDSGSAAATINTPQADNQESADFALMIEESAKEMRSEDGVTANAIQSLVQIRETDKVGSQNGARQRATADTLEKTPRPCTREQLAEPTTWWQCISDLEEAGRHDEATAELDLFNMAHPDFEAPENPPSP